MSDFQTQYAQVYQSIIGLSLQVKDAIAQVQNVSIPPDYSHVRNLVMCGMGGSGLAARVIESAYTRELKIPLTRVNDYNLPGFVDENTLVICASYSGTTEETIENFHQALAKKAKVIVIASGEELAKLAEQNQVPAFIFKPTHNSSNEPRLGLGYALSGQIAILQQLNLLPITESDIQSIFDALEKVVAKQSNLNPIVMQLHQHQIIIITSRHLLGAAHTIKNQLNESAKTLCHLYDIPELNHHFLEGMQFPAAENRHTAIISMNSALFDKKISSRLKLTNEIITNQGYPVIEFLPQSSTILGQIFETIQWGSLITHQLTEMYQVNPTTLPYVDEFKAKLKQI